MNERFDVVVACDLNRGIGKDNQIPWRLPGDLKHFKKLTSVVRNAGLYNAVIMGRKTWESIPPQFRPLPDRYNVVLTRNVNYRLPEGVFRCSSLDEAIDLLAQGPVEQAFVIGGAEVYNQALENNRVGLLYLTEVRQRFDCDTFFPEYKDFFQLVTTSEIQTENGIDYCFKVYKPNFLV